MDVQARDVPSGRFFVTADPPPHNVYYMLVSLSMRLDDTGVCQNINDESYWTIQGHRMVRLIREDEHDQRVFHI